MIKTLTRSIQADNGRVYACKEGRRVLISECSVKVEFYNYKAKIPILGTSQTDIKERHVHIVVGSDHEYTRNIDTNYLSSISTFDLSFDIQREDGIFETITCNNAIPIEIDIDDKWIFDITNNKDILRFK